MNKKTRIIVFVAMLILTIFTIQVSFAEENVITKRKTEIYSQYKSLLEIFNDTNEIFIESPKFSPPNSSGKLTDALLKSGLATNNFIRFIAELPSDVVLDETWNISAQNAALISAVNGKISHMPEKPNLMSEELYLKALDGAKKSNLYYSYGYSYAKYPYKAIYDPILNFMNDSDSLNIKKLGHRRWILNPAMTKIGLGYVKNSTSNHFAAMKVFDDNENIDSNINYDYISWPAKNAFPLEFFGNDQAWSISLNPDIYDLTKTSSINVKLRDLTNGKDWIFDRDLSDKNLFYVDTNSFGIPYCVIFKPNEIKYTDGNYYEVTLNGVYDKAGNRTSLKFNTEFFSLKTYESDKTKTIDMEPSSWAARDINILRSSDILRKESFENFHNNITRNDFIYLAVKVYEKLSNSKININDNIKFSDTDDFYALKAATVGITNGIGGGKFGPNLEITREQVATLMVKVIKLAGKNLSTSNSYTFADDADISSWAKEAVYIVKGNNIINGVGNDNFNPKGKATVEQALIITKKILDL